MKKILSLALIICLKFSCFSQEQLPKDSVNIGAELNYMKYSLYRNHAQWSNGAICTAFGTVISGFGVVINMNGDGGENGIGGYAAMGVGGVVALIGTIIMIDSHKWIQRAGFGLSRSEYGYGIKYRFKN